MALPHFLLSKYILYNWSMSFAHNIKLEILEQEFAEKNAKAFVSGLIAATGVKEDNNFIVKVNKEDICSHIEDMLGQMNIKHSKNEQNKNWVVIHDFVKLDKISQPSYFFAGCFVGGGSISDTQSTSYHLEMQFYNESEAEKVQTFLNKYSFNFNMIQRKKMFVLYLKRSEQISDFLKAIQAFKSLMKFEDARISRDFRNQLNRYSNLDTYNQHKLAISSEEFIHRWDFIKERDLTHKFRPEEIAFFELKTHQRYSSLQELAELYNKKMKTNKTKSGLNHWLIKLKNIYERFDQ